jgi:hypothetical protein
METFTQAKQLVSNPQYAAQRRAALEDLQEAAIDAPLVELMQQLNRLPYCFTLQCCYGHFVYPGRDDPHNLEPLPATAPPGGVEYRIAYLALCVENSPSGKGLLELLKEVTAIDPDNVQFGCATWFWERQVNSYVLQVEPDRYKHQDRADLGYEEALHIENLRNEFLARLGESLRDSG